MIKFSRLEERNGWIIFLLSFIFFSRVIILILLKLDLKYIIIYFFKILIICINFFVKVYFRNYF